jgi:hypothetical protein
VNRDELMARLAAMEEEWKSAPVGGGGLFDLPEADGDYEARIQLFDFLELDVHGTRQAHLKMQVCLQNTPEGAYDGRLPGLLWNLEDAERLTYLKRDMAKMGVDVEQTPISEFVPGSDTLSSLLDNVLIVAVRTSSKLKENGQPYRNMYINESLGFQGAPPTGPASDLGNQHDFDFGAFGKQSGPADDDDIPF